MKIPLLSGVLPFDRSRLPGAVLGAIAASAAFGLSRHGIGVIGEVPGGLPSPSIPSLKTSEIYQVLATAATCFIVILAQSAATARAYANRYNERFDENLDLVGANAAAAFTGTFVVNGSPTKTEMVDSTGGRVRQSTGARVRQSMRSLQPQRRRHADARYYCTFTGRGSISSRIEAGKAARKDIAQE